MWHRGTSGYLSKRHERTPSLISKSGEAAAFCLNLGGKAELNELLREWKATHAKIVSGPEDKPWSSASLWSPTLMAISFVPYDFRDEM